MQTGRARSRCAPLRAIARAAVASAMATRRAMGIPATMLRGMPYVHRAPQRREKGAPATMQWDAP
eukprot:8551230-Pyramimonas_sp.AAC.1